MRPVDKMGMGPERTHELLKNGNYKVTVTPPAWSGFTKGSSIELSPNQFRRYMESTTGTTLIQNALPELNTSQREMLLSGITPDEWEEKITIPALEAELQDAKERCPDCEGTGGLYASEGGKVLIDEPCQTCGGTGVK